MCSQRLCEDKSQWKARKRENCIPAVCYFFANGLVGVNIQIFSLVRRARLVIAHLLVNLLFKDSVDLVSFQLSPFHILMPSLTTSGPSMHIRVSVMNEQTNLVIWMV